MQIDTDKSSKIMVLIFVVILMCCFGYVNSALAMAIAEDWYFFSEKDTQIINWLGANNDSTPTDLKFLYKHWGDGGAEPASFTDKLGGTGKKPDWSEQWDGRTIPNTHTAVHTKGSISKSEWELKFVRRMNLYPGIDGKLVAIADKNNLTLQPTEANTKTAWSDPFLFSLPANTSATIGVQHRFTNDQDSGDHILAKWIPDFASDTGQAGVFRRFMGQVTDANNVWGTEQTLQFVQIGTSLDLINLVLGDGVSLDDGYPASEKKQRLLENLSGSTWLLTPGSNDILLDFTWTLPAVNYSRMVKLDVSGGVFAQEAQVIPEPSTLLLLGSGLAGIIGFGRKRLFQESI